MNTELIRFAREHRYKIAEGFCLEGREAVEWQDVVNSALAKFPALREKLEAEAEELANAAGITIEEAESALLNKIILAQLQSLI